MLSDAVKRLRDDKRLYRRSGWLSSDEIAAQLEALPDVADKRASDDDAQAGDASSVAND